MTNETYIHNGIEVRTTGRTATKKKKRTTRKPGDQIAYMHEVKPIDEKIDWLEWVDLEVLFKVEGDENV